MADYWINRLAVHLDYLHLICGLAWLLFGCLGRFGMEGRNRRAGGWWQVAVLLLALEQWSRGFNESCGPGTNRELANFLLTLAPGFLLLEYAWQIFRAPGRWLPVRCIIYAGLLAMAGWLSLGASPGGMVFLQLAVIIPGALASLAMLPGAGGLPTREGRWLGLAAFGLVVFMVSVAGVDTFDRALFFVHPDSTAHRYWRPCLVLGQLLLSWSAVGVLITCQRIKCQRGAIGRGLGSPAVAEVSAHGLAATGPDAGIPLETRWVLLAWFVVLLIGAVGGRLAGQNRAAEIRNNLLHRTALGAAAIDPDWLTGLAASTNDLGRPEYRLLKEQLHALDQASPDCPFVYVLKPGPGAPVFFADSQPGTAPGDPFYEVEPAVLAGLQQGQPFVYGPFTGHWGWHLAGFAVIHDHRSGQPLGWLGMGFRATDWNLFIAQARLAPLIGTWLVCLLLLSFTVGYQKAAAATRLVTTSERRYRQLFERNPAVMLLIDPESGRILDANPAACRFYRLSAERLRGGNLRDLSPDSADAFLERMRAIVTGSQDFFTARHQLGNGEWRDVEMCAGPVDTGERWVLHCIVQDVSERRRAEAELRKREMILAGMAEAGQLLLLEKDLTHSMHAALAALGGAVGADRVYVYENLPATAGGPLLSSLLFQWTGPRAPAPAHPARRLDLPLEKIRPRWVTAMRAGLPVYGRLEEFDASECTLLEALGVLSFVAIPIQIEKNFWGFIGFDDCQTPRLWSQSEIDALRATAGPIGNAIIRARATEELIRARNAAEAADKAKSEFLATMSHELRTPMNAVIGMTSLLRDTPLEPRQLDFVEAVRSSGEALMEIINDILDFSKIESGKMVIEQEEFNLRSIVDGVLELLAPRAHAKNLELAGLLGPGVPAGLRGDDGRLRQILVNLMVNGIKFTEAGEVVLRVECLAQDAVRAKLRFCVTDTGPGITSEQQLLLFQPFSQADSTVTRKHGGTGLGLAICKRLVGLMGGEIGLDSTPGMGSTFWFDLQFAVVEPVAGLFPGLHLPPACILVVDRHAVTREAIVSLLQSWNLEYAEAISLNEAVEKTEQARREQKPFNVTLVENDLCIGSLATLTGVVLLNQANMTPAGRLPASVVAQLTKPLKQSQLFDCLAMVLTGQPSPMDSARNVPDTRPAEASALAQLRILVAEDNDVNRRLAMFMLQKLGCQSDFASDGQETIQAWEAIPYDVILMDCHMPVVDGYSATRKIRELELQPAHAGRPHTQIIAMTANAMRGDREKCLAAGMDDYISKPVRLELLHTALSRVLAERPPLPPSPALAGDQLEAIEASVLELARELGAEATNELLTSFLNDTPGALADLSSLARAGVPETYARAAHSLAGSCSIFGLTELRHLALELEDCAGGSDPAAGEALITRLNQGYQTCRPVLERLRAAINSPTEP